MRRRIAAGRVTGSGAGRGRPCPEPSTATTTTATTTATRRAITYVPVAVVGNDVDEGPADGGLELVARVSHREGLEVGEEVEAGNRSEGPPIYCGGRGGAVSGAGQGGGWRMDSSHGSGGRLTVVVSLHLRRRRGVEQWVERLALALREVLLFPLVLVTRDALDHL